MTREELKNIVRHVFRFYDINADNCNWADMNEACGEIIKALEQEPYEKFESAKDHICKLAGDYKCWDNRLTADEAIELCRILEQEPCEDAVSLAQVFEILGNLMSIPYDFDRPINKDDVSESMDAIRALPPVTPIRKAGKWIVLKDEYGDIVEAVCSCCDVPGHHKWRFCPHCGAEMESEE